MISDKERQILESLASKEYREAFSSDVGTGIAFQVKLMRENRGWSQSDLADRLGTNHSRISRWENPNYGRYSLTTLKALAAVFDVALLVKFIPFSELVKDLLSISDVSLSPPSYDSEKEEQ